MLVKNVTIKNLILVALSLSAASSAYGQAQPPAAPPQQNVEIQERVLVPTNDGSWITEFPETPKLNPRLVQLRKRCAGLQSNIVKVTLGRPEVADFAKKQHITATNLDMVDNTSRVLEGDDAAKHMSPRITLRANQFGGQAVHVIYNIDHTGACNLVQESTVVAEFTKWIATIAVGDAAKVNQPPGKQPGAATAKKDTPAPNDENLSLDAFLKRMTEKSAVAGDLDHADPNAAQVR